MIEYFLGIITGLVVSVFILLAIAHFRPVIERILNQTVSKLKKKGEIIEPDSEELKDWIDNLKSE